MPKYRKCCVVGCKSNYETHRLFNFPLNDKLRALWLSFITPYNIELNELSKSQLRNKYVCQKHFDRQQFDSKGSRLAYGYPCLFSDEEIIHGMPLSNFQSPSSDLDHCYSKKRDVDGDADTSIPTITDNGTSIKRRKAESGLTTTSNDNNVQISKSNNNYTPVGDNDVTIDQATDEDDFEESIDITTEDNDITTEEEDNAKGQDIDIEFIREFTLIKTPISLQHTDFKCNVCQGEIVGFRYTCLQCLDWDMCASCEARGEHPEHYVLRLPAPRPQAELGPLIAAIREQIQDLHRRIEQESICIKEEKDITEEFDPNLTDPFSVTTDGNVPELYHYNQIATDYETTIESAIDSDNINSITPVIDAQSLSELKHAMKQFTKSSDQRVTIRLNAKQGPTRYRTQSEVNECLQEVLDSMDDSSVIIIKPSYVNSYPS